ncbi:unnamed protein product, partial [Rotaria sordida]
VSFGLVSAGGFGRPSGDSHHDDSHHGGPIGERNSGNTKESKLCDNSTLVQSYVNQMQTTITQLNNNDSFTNFFQQRKEELSYLQNADNTAFLTSNCTQYFKNLDAARASDKVAQNLRARNTDIANRLLENILDNCQTQVRDYGRQKFRSVHKY